jgi:hypothetical protein
MNTETMNTTPKSTNLERCVKASIRDTAIWSSFVAYFGKVPTALAQIGLAILFTGAAQITINPYF